VQRIADFIRATLNLRVFLPLLAVVLVATWFGLSWSADRFAGLTDGLHFMDMQPRLTADELFAQIRTYAPETVEFYLWWSLFDYAWPLLTFTAMLYISAWLFGFLPIPSQRRFPLLVASAYLTVLMDWGENIGFAVLVLGLPEERTWLAHLTLTLHAAKLFFDVMFNIGFSIVLVAVVVTQLKSRLGRAG